MAYSSLPHRTTCSRSRLPSIPSLSMPTPTTCCSPPSPHPVSSCPELSLAPSTRRCLASLSLLSPPSLPMCLQSTSGGVSVPVHLSTTPFPLVYTFLTLCSRMLAGISCLSSSHLPVSIPKSQVPSALSVPVRNSSSQPTYPTHILAIAPSKSSPNEHACLFPVHSVIIASQCTTLPRLPPSNGLSAGTVLLPVLPLNLPSPAAFKILHTYLYDHSLEGLMRSLFPLPSPFVQSLSHHTIQSTLASGSSLHQLSTYLSSATGGSLQALTTHAAHVKELWQDIVALGIHDPELWDALDLSWEVVLGALNLAATGH